MKRLLSGLKIFSVLWTSFYICASSKVISKNSQVFFEHLLCFKYDPGCWDLPIYMNLSAVLEVSMVWGKMTKNSSQIFIPSLLVVRMLLMKDPLD